MDKLRKECLVSLEEDDAYFEIDNHLCLMHMISYQVSSRNKKETLFWKEEGQKSSCSIPTNDGFI